jgi:tetratricopeptide (TPR) repeat protein
MLTNEPSGTPTSPDRAERRKSRRSRRWNNRRTRKASKSAAFLLAAGLVIAYALPGGSYDIVVRQEYGLVLWWVIAIGVAIGLLPRSRPALPVWLLIGALTAYAGWTALSLTWTVSSERTFAEVARVMDYLGVVVLASFVLDRRTWKAAAAGLGVGAMAVCVLALGSRLWPSAFPIDWAARTFRADRLDYPFGYWNAVGAWGAMAAALALAWSAHDPLRTRRSLALGLVPVAATVTYLTYSRAAVAAVVLAVVAVLALSRNRITVLVHTLLAGVGTGIAVLAIRAAPQIAQATGTVGAGSVLAAVVFAFAVCAAGAALTSAVRSDRWRTPRRTARSLAAVLCAAVLILAAAFGPHLASKAWDSFRNTGVNNASAPTTQRLTNLSGTRYNLWAVALDAFRAKPATGSGAGTYQFYWDQHQRDSESVRNAHSLWLENMAELGLPGLVLIIAVALAALGVAFTARRRSRRSASAGACTALLCVMVVYLLSASVDWMWQSTAVTVFALGATGIAGARMSGGRKPMRWPARVALVLFAAGASFVQIPGLLATAEIRRSQAAERAGHPAQALAWADEAAGAEPWSASAYEQRALVLEAGGRLRAAVSDETRAQGEEPTNYVHPLILARLETELGHYRLALRDYRRARQLGRLATVFTLPPGPVSSTAGG